MRIWDGVTDTHMKHWDVAAFACNPAQTDTGEPREAHGGSVSSSVVNSVQIKEVCVGFQHGLAMQMPYGYSVPTLRKLLDMEQHLRTVLSSICPNITLTIK